MDDSVDVTVESDDDATTVRVHDDSGAVDADGTTVRFSFSTTGESEETDAGTDAEADGEPRRIAPLEAVPVDSTLRFEACNGKRGVECILRREGDAIVAWRNSCPHEPDVRLDPGDGAIVTDDAVVCHAHGARFERGDGNCTYGPCKGDSLDPVVVSVRDDAVYLTDDRFESATRL